MNTPSNHFFASSASRWMTTSPDRDLRDLIKAMDREGLPYNLFLVQLPHDAKYSIRQYAPDVPEATWVGLFEPRGRRSA
jgi:hypothetical protein